MVRSWLAVAFGLAALGGAQAAEPGYLDDRSNPAALVRSFYNAVNRKEYARAWSYFGETKPASDFEKFVSGFKNTDRVDVVTGAASEEGAAGSIFYNLPVAIVAFAADGTESVYAGCYVARLANPQIQEPPFAGLHIEKANLSASEQPYEEKLPKQCGDGPPAEPTDAGLEKATAIFVTAHAGDCQAVRPDGTTDAPQINELTFRYKSAEESEPDQKARLFGFYCGSGAYNETHIYYLETANEGVEELQFAMPELDIHYVNNDTEGNVESVNIIGYTARAQMVNSDFDPATQTLSAFSKWRGVGDASSSGQWLFRDGEFSLVHYEVDASYDGEINPETVLDYNSAP